VKQHRQDNRSHKIHILPYRECKQRFILG
jgi:hypothetical protein